MDLNHEQVLEELKRYSPYVQVIVGPDFDTQVPAELKDGTALENIASFGALSAEETQALAEASDALEATDTVFLRILLHGSSLG